MSAAKIGRILGRRLLMISMLGSMIAQVVEEDSVPWEICEQMITKLHLELAYM